MGRAAHARFLTNTRELSAAHSVDTSLTAWRRTRLVASQRRAGASLAGGTSFQAVVIKAVAKLGFTQYEIAVCNSASQENVKGVLHKWKFHF